MRNNSLLFTLSNNPSKKMIFCSDFSGAISYTLFSLPHKTSITRVKLKSCSFLLLLQALIVGNISFFLSFHHLVTTNYSLFVSSKIYTQITNWLNSNMNWGSNLSQVCLRGYHESGINGIGK